MRPDEVSMVMLMPELEEYVRVLRAHGDFVFIPFVVERLPPPTYAGFEDLPDDSDTTRSPRRVHRRCVLCDKSVVPTLQYERSKSAPESQFVRTGQQAVIKLTVNQHLDSGDSFFCFEIGDAVLQSDGSWAPMPDRLTRAFAHLKSEIKRRCRYVASERWYVTPAALERLRSLENPPDWVKNLPAVTRRQAAKRSTAMLSYDESFDTLKKAAGLEGQPRPDVSRRPAYDDEPPGPSFFRTSVADQRFGNIKLPGLYIGRSELANGVFAGSDLHLAAWNWSEFKECDFSRCDLHDSDLRACEFENCNFSNADLRKCDLRGSRFVECDFTGARLDQALVLEEQRSELRLTPEQQAAVTWTDAYEEPPGG